MINLKLIHDQPRWRVALIHGAARLIGVLVHVEGFPFGSKRNYRQGKSALGEIAGAASKYPIEGAGLG